jgi:hypothetical protein
VTIGLTTVLWVKDKLAAPLAERSARRSEPYEGHALIVLFTLVTWGLVLLVILATDSPAFDRYLIALVPFAAAVLIRAALDNQLMARPTRAVAITSLAGFGLVGLNIVDASATFDGGKWQLAEKVERRGFAASTIDGGYEWFGYHQTDPVHQRPRIEGTSFWVTLFSARPICVTSSYEDSAPAGERSAVLESFTGRSLTGITYRLHAVVGPQRCGPLP